MQTVLIVDDHPDTCNLLIKLLRIIGYKAECVQNGDSALAYVQSTKPGLIILDVMMPGMNGFDVLRSLKENPAVSDVPVVMHSAWDDENVKRISLRDGAQGFFGKTKLGYSQLKEVVEQFLGPVENESVN